MTKKSNKKAQTQPKMASNQKVISNSVSNQKAKSSGKVSFASAAVFRQPTQIVRSAAPFSPRYGNGLKCTGRQYLTSIITGAADTTLFSGNSPATANIIYISPDSFNGRLALEARTFQRYLFTKLRFIYTPRVAVTQAGEMVLAYYSDGQENIFATVGFTASQDSDCCVVSSFHNGGQALIWDVAVPMGAQDSYYCELDSTSAASLRQTVQGQLVGYPDVTSIGAITMGNLSVEYEILFYCPTTDFGFTVSRIHSEEEAAYLKHCQEEFRRKETSLKLALPGYVSKK